MRTQLTAAVLALSLAFTPACGKIDPKAPAAVLKTSTVAQSALETFQDLIRSECDPLAPALTPIAQCKSDSVLSTAQFKSLSAQLAVAFHLDHDVALALKTYKPGQAVPLAFQQLMTIAIDFVNTLMKLPSSPHVAALLAGARTVLAVLQDIATKFQ